MQLNDLRVNLTLDNNGFRLSVAESGRILRQFEQTLGSTADQSRRTESALASFGSRAHNMIQSMGMMRFALMDVHDVFLSLPKAIISSGAEIERLTKLMEGLSTQTDATKKKLEAASSVKFVFGLAQNAPFEVKALTDTFVKLKTGGIDPTKGAMQALVDSVAKFGGSSEELKRASIAIMQMSGKGVISMEELRQQLGEAIPSAMAAMAVGMKMSMAELNKAVSNGTVVAGGAMKKMFAVMSVDNAGAAAEMMTTWTGMMERLKTQWEMWKLGAAGEGFADAAKEGLKGLIDEMKSPEAASFGRRVGESLANTTNSIIDLSKTIAKYWDEVKTAGELLLTAWVGEKMLPVLTSVRNTIAGYYATVQAGAANVRASLAMEAQGRRDQMLANAQFLENTIATNEAAIASNQAAAAANRAMRARELTDLIAQNQAILGVYAARATANAAAMAAALPSNSPAVAAVSRGTATAAQDLEAQVLLHHAEAARLDQAAIAGRTAALQAENAAMAQERLLLNTTTAALTADSEARALANAHLVTSATRFRDNAAAVTQSNTAMAMMKSAATTVVSAIGSMVFSMGGLMVAIMAGIWAWNSWSEAADKAAKNAKIAFDTKKRLEEGKFNEDTLKASEDNIETLKADIATLKRQIIAGQGNSRGMKRDTSDLQRQLDEKEKALPVFENNLAIERKRVAQKAGEEAGRSMVQEYVDGVNRSMADVSTKVGAITEKYDAKKLAQAGKLTDEQMKSQAQELYDVRSNALQGAIKTYDKNITDLKARIANEQAIVANSKSTAVQVKAAQEEITRLNAAVNGVSEQKINTGTTLANLQAPNDLTAGKNKAKHETTDSVQRELASSKVSLDKLQTALEAMDNQAIDLKALRAGVDSHIDAIIDSDKERHIVQKHTPRERELLASALEEKSLIEELKKQYGSLAKDRASVSDQYTLANEKMLTGNFSLEGKTKSELKVDSLKATLDAMENDGKVAPKVIADYKAALADAQAILNGENFVAGVNAYASNQKSIDAMKTGNIVNERARLAAQQAQENADLAKKYDGQYTAAKGNEEILAKLRAQFRAEDLLLAERHTNEMKTPLEKLGEQWADVTKNMQNATANWATSAMDAFTTLAMTGKFEFSSLVKSILADLIKIQLQASLGTAMKGIMGTLGTFASGLLGGGATTSSVSLPESSLLPLDYGAVPHANGGVFGSMGSMPLRKYAAGGVATSPQLALFGEGSMNEAYVPLPDGRSIPVTMSGTGNQGTAASGVSIGIQVNVAQNGGTTTDVSGDGDATQWTKVAAKVKDMVQTTIAEEQRPGGLLYK